MEEESFLEKERKHRDRTKKRRIKPDETNETEQSKPRMEPYKRTHKNWVDQTDEE